MNLPSASCEWSACLGGVLAASIITAYKKIEAMLAVSAGIESDLQRYVQNVVFIVSMGKAFIASGTCADVLVPGVRGIL